MSQFKPRGVDGLAGIHTRPGLEGGLDRSENHNFILMVHAATLQYVRQKILAIVADFPWLPWASGKNTSGFLA